MSPNELSSRYVVRGNLVLDRTRHQVIVHGRTHRLTPIECDLLTTFMQHAGEVLTREYLMREVWKTEFTDDTRTLEVHVCWLRSKIEKDASRPQLLRTIRGVGYMFGETPRNGGASGRPSKR